MSSAKTLRWMRVGQIGALALNAGVLAFGITRSAGLIILPLIACILGLLLAIRLQTKTIQRREYLDRPRPDYTRIASLEREVYGETFKHEGAPNQVPQIRSCCGTPLAGGHAGTCRHSLMNGGKSEEPGIRVVKCKNGHDGLLWVDNAEYRGVMCPKCDWKRQSRQQMINDDRHAMRALAAQGRVCSACTAPLGDVRYRGKTGLSLCPECHKQEYWSRSNIRWERPS